jgi:hypothetical protein
MESEDLLLALMYIVGVSWALWLVYPSEEDFIIKLLAIVLWPIAIVAAFVCFVIGLLVKE